MPALPDLPPETAVWAEANAALLDQLRRADPGHALRRLARATVHLLGNGYCRIEAMHEGVAVAGGLFEATRERLDPSPASSSVPSPAVAWQHVLTHHGSTVGRL